MRKGLTKKANDLTALAPKWSERGHLLAALPKHLAETQEAIKTQQNIDKEMTDLALIANAWMKSQQQKELLEARLKRFKETAGYPSMASKTYYHGSPDSNIGSLRAGSYVSPDKRIAEIMGRFHEGTGKTWTDEDLSKPFDFGPDIHWKPGREPMGKPNIYSINASPEQLDLLNNPYEHRLKSDMTTEKLARAEKFGSDIGKSMGKSARFMIVPRLKNTREAGIGALIGAGIGGLGGGIYGAINPGKYLETEGPEEKKVYYTDYDGKRRNIVIDDEGNPIYRQRGKAIGALLHGLAGGLVGAIPGGLIGDFTGPR